MQLMHNGLKDLLLLNNYSSQKIGFVSLETELPDWFKKITQAIPNYTVGLQIRREYRHITMGLRALKLNDVDKIFIFEIYNQHLLFLLPLLSIMAIKGKEILISLHGNQQFAMSSKIKYWGLIYLKMYLKLFPQMKVITFEIDDDVIPEKYRLPATSKFVIPHPLISEAKPKLMPGERFAPEKIIKIGVVGIIRQDKPIAEVIKKIQEYLNSNPSGCELVIGTPLAEKPTWLDELNAQLYDTTEESDYIKVLQEIDILVIHYQPERYYYRTSGVISDAASCGCYIIASDYPVIKHQINYPVTIGATFQDFAEIPSLIAKGITSIQKNGKDANWQWREKRTAEAIAAILTA